MMLFITVVCQLRRMRPLVLVTFVSSLILVVLSRLGSLVIGICWRVLVILVLLVLLVRRVFKVLRVRLEQQVFKVQQARLVQRVQRQLLQALRVRQGRLAPQDLPGLRVQTEKFYR